MSSIPRQRYFSLFRPHLPELGVAVGLSAAMSGAMGLAAYLMAGVMDALNTLGKADAATRFPMTLRFLDFPPLFSGYEVSLNSLEATFLLLGKVMGAVLLAVFLKGILTFAYNFLVNRITYRIMTDTRNALHAKMLSLPLREVSAQRTGDLMARALDDVNVLTQSAFAFSNVFRSVVMILVFLCLMLLKSWMLTAGFLVVAPVVGFTVQYFGKRVRRDSARIQREMGNVSSRLQETIYGIKVIKGFGVEAEERKRFFADTRELYRMAMRRVRAVSLQSPIAEFLIMAGLVAVFALGCWQVLSGDLTFGGFLAHLVLMGMLREPVKGLAQFNSLFQQGLASVQRIEDVFSLPSEDVTTGTRLPNLRGEVVFENVTFAYESEPVLNAISFSANAGETVAIVGRSGSGKTTLLNLIPRLYEPDFGRILMDGVPASGIRLPSLRSHIGMVLQESVLFAGTIEANIRFARPTASETEVVEAARRAHAHEFIAGFPDGYQTRIGERGVRLSGGQQQRIAIARAFLKNPRIFLLDEATAALDSESEAYIQKSFDELLRDRTAFVIAHRLSTILNADKILVLDNGTLVESGTHAELLAKNGVYTRLYETQFRRELFT